MGTVLYQERASRGMSPKSTVIAGATYPIAQLSSDAWTNDTARKSARCIPTTHARTGVRGTRAPTARTIGISTARLIHRGIVEMRMLGQSIGMPCLTDTCRASSAPKAPSARQATTTTRLAPTRGERSSRASESSGATVSRAPP